MVHQVTVYEKPTGTKCRNLAVLLRDNGIDYDKVNYFIDELSEKLRELLKKAVLARPIEKAIDLLVETRRK